MKTKIVFYEQTETVRTYLKEVLINERINQVESLFLFLINSSQTKFVAIILVLWSFYAIFRLTDFLSDPFDFSFSKTG